MSKNYHRMHLEKSKDAIERKMDTLRADMRRLQRAKAVGPLKEARAEFELVRQQYQDVLREIAEMKRKGEW